MTTSPCCSNSLSYRQRRWWYGCKVAIDQGRLKASAGLAVYLSYAKAFGMIFKHAMKKRHQEKLLILFGL